MDLSNKRGTKRRVAAYASDSHHHNKGRKNNRVDIYDNSHYYSTDYWNKLSTSTNSKLLSNQKIISEKHKIDTVDNKRSTNVSSSSVTATAKDETQKAAKINA